MQRISMRSAATAIIHLKCPNKRMPSYNIYYPFHHEMEVGLSGTYTQQIHVTHIFYSFKLTIKSSSFIKVYAHRIAENLWLVIVMHCVVNVFYMGAAHIMFTCSHNNRP